MDRDPVLAVRVYRVTVRGRFADLSDRARRHLATSRDDHDVFRSQFSEEGTLSYDQRLDFFNLRYEIRLTDDADAGVEAAATEALARAEAFLRTLQFGFRDLRTEVMDLTAMTEQARRSR